MFSTVGPIEREEDDTGWEHMRAALIAIVAGVISFLTIVGNIMVRHILENILSWCWLMTILLLGAVVLVGATAKSYIEIKFSFKIDPIF